MTTPPDSRSRTDDIRAFLLRAIDESGKDVARLAGEHFGITRQAIHRHMRNLQAEGLVSAKGKTRKRQYELVDLDKVRITLPLQGLEEGEVWRTHILRFMEPVPGRALQVANFAFTEMVNNAIDHSGGTALLVSATRTARSVNFTILDNGVGIFRKIAAALELPNELQAVLELSKGKFTTDPSKHSGMGIFFTSRACDRMTVDSSGIMLMHTESGRDFVFEDSDDRGEHGGTIVRLTIHLDTDRDLYNLFKEYEGTDVPGFSKTIVPVKLAEQGDDNLVSRSQAKRVLARVERFAEVIFDFNNVERIGQAFADEIFRVFQIEHPEVSLLPANMNDVVRQMVHLAWAGLAEQGHEPPFAKQEREQRELTESTPQ